MTTKEQAQHILAMWPKYRFQLSSLIRLYMVQDSFAVAEDRISFLSAGQVDETFILEQISEYEGELEPAARRDFLDRERQLKNAIADAAGLERETNYSRHIRQHENALNASI